MCSCAQAVGCVIAPSVAMMTGHRHSTRTPGLLRLAKKPRDFRGPGATEIYFTSLAQAWQKGSIFRLEEARECVRTDGAQRGTTGKESRRRSKRFEGGPTSRPPKTRLHYKHIKKTAKRCTQALSLIVFRSVYATGNVNKLRSSLYPLSLPSLLSVPARKPPLSFCLLCLFHSSFFPGGSYYASLRLHCRDPINQCKIFALTGLTERAALPSMGTKTCRHIANKKQLTVAN